MSVLDNVMDIVKRADNKKLTVQTVIADFFENHPYLASAKLESYSQYDNEDGYYKSYSTSLKFKETNKALELLSIHTYNETLEAL